MADTINQGLVSEVNVATIINQEGFSKLEPEIKNLVIESISNQTAQENSAGKFGRFFGTEPTIVSMNIGLFVCILLFAILVVDLLRSLLEGKEIDIELIKTILPTFTLYLGYLFGKKS